jgi:nucleoside-diphosphate-sugar epimerase
MTKAIGIAGLGWLGKPLASKLMTLGYPIKGTVTSTEKATALQNKGINAFPLEITESGVTGEPKGFLKDIATLIVMIPPGLRRNTGADYVLKMTHFLAEIETAKVPNCIFISSTSVYGDTQGKVTETDMPKPENEAGRQLKQVEQLFFSSASHTSIVRFGGLLGGTRQPAKYLAGRKNLSSGNAPVNLIHREDCIRILVDIIKQDAYGHIFNAVHPDHPTKANYYTKKAKELDLEIPHFSAATKEEVFKQVDSVNLEKVLAFNFIRTI